MGRISGLPGPDMGQGVTNFSRMNIESVSAELTTCLGVQSAGIAVSSQCQDLDYITMQHLNSRLAIANCFWRSAALHNVIQCCKHCHYHLCVSSLEPWAKSPHHRLSTRLMLLPVQYLVEQMLSCTKAAGAWRHQQSMPHQPRQQSPSISKICHRLLKQAHAAAPGMTIA